MTGFGKSSAELPNKKIAVEVKSLNSKQLDLTLRVPALLREKEMEMRNSIGRRLERGKVEMNVYIESQATEHLTQINLPAAAEYKEQVSAMAKQLGIPEPQDWYSVLLRFPDTMKTETSMATVDDEEYASISATVDEAVEALVKFRRSEGLKLEEFFTVRIERIRTLLAEVPRYEQERIERIRTRISDNLSNLPQVEYDRGRLEQEMIFYIEKLDINEEKQRLAQHLDYFMETMNGAPGQGKKLGFISQEMGREINTLGSKSNHADMQRLVVRMKDELEQIKEQVLNVL